MKYSCQHCDIFGSKFSVQVTEGGNADTASLSSGAAADAAAAGTQ